MSIAGTIIRMLLFKLTREEMLSFKLKHLVVGLIGTWIVGMGRYWDDEKAGLFQHLGLVSVVYIFVLAAFIWLILKPFLIDDWNYFTVLTFISLTSFPAVLYAIPVERFMNMETANSFNVWFLAIVAGWRLFLLFYFLKRFTKLHIGNILTVTLMPICLIITSLTALNLHRVVFMVMGGIRSATPHDAAYGVLISLTVISMILMLPLLMSYLMGIYFRREEKRRDDRLEY